MSVILDYMSKDHKRCDELFADAEREVAARHWKDARRLFLHFQKQLERHFRAEEQVLFPAMEGHSADSWGPIGVMRHEHEQIRDGLSDMTTAVDQEDQASYLTTGEAVLIMIQQHNLKEEQILYPMSDRVLCADATELLEQLRSS